MCDGRGTDVNSWLRIVDCVTLIFSNTIDWLTKQFPAMSATANAAKEASHSMPIALSAMSATTTAAKEASHSMPTALVVRKRTLPDPHSRQERNNLRSSLVAGSFSGILSTLIIYPMDVIRTKMQTGGGGPIHVLKNTFDHGGVRALYTGLGLPLAAQAVYKATVFTVNNITQNAILDFRNKNQVGMAPSLTLNDRFVCGFVGGAVNGALFVTPVELVRNQLIAQHSKLATSTLETSAANKVSLPSFRGSWDVIRYVVQSQRPLSLWRGISWSVARDGVGCGCFFYTIAWTQKTLTPRDEKPSMPVVLFSGGLAGLAYWVTALPLDSIKTWIQSSDISMSSLSTRETIRKIYAEHGLVGLFYRLNRGWQVAYGRGIPSSAITIATYSAIYDRLQKLHN
jgi:solute carrier family 25 (mitochondrial carnitine/acylcarnitine transporter), member 20/29